MKIIIAGSGGQGILFMGKMLAFAGMLAQKKVTWFPSYGAEMRGGTANCTVIVSDSMIGSPVVLNPDLLVAMNKISLDRFLPALAKKGLLFYDSSIISEPGFGRDLRTVPVPAIHIAGALGSVKSANMVMLGALLAKTGILDIKFILEVFADPMMSGGSEVNIKSFMEGTAYIENTKSKNPRP